MSIHTLPTWRPALATCGLVGVGYLVGWSRGSRWTHDTLADPTRQARLDAPHWS